LNRLLFGLLERLAERFLLENKDKFSILTKNIIENSLEKIKTRVANKEDVSHSKYLL
jgi:hypothetical protein